MPKIRIYELQKCMLPLFDHTHSKLARCQVPVDGKTVSRSFDAASGLSALHMVQALATDENIVLAR